MNASLGTSLRDLNAPILITGHTGFKGTWLTLLLEHLGVPVIGYSLPAVKNSLYNRANFIGSIPESFDDIRNIIGLESFLKKHRPAGIIHMAAQPLILESYKFPRETFDTNVMGTVNVLDAAFKSDFVKAVVVVTTDKVYKNDNTGVRFLEMDPLEGKDPYSASKVGAEAAIFAWQQIGKISGGPKVVSARAGNVIGGGDWADNRLIPDLIRALIAKKPIEIRNPESTRPWQHVLDPLVGYLMLLEGVLSGLEIQSMNFAPNEESLKVSEVVDISLDAWGLSAGTSTVLIRKEQSLHEAHRLSLDAGFAEFKLGWKPRWTQISAIQETIGWWKRVLLIGENPKELCMSQIQDLGL